MFIMIIVFALFGEPQTHLNLYSLSQESCSIELLAVESVFQNMGVTQYSAQCIRAYNEN